MDKGSKWIALEASNLFITFMAVLVVLLLVCTLFLHYAKRNGVGYVGLVVAVAFPSFLCKKPNGSLSERTIDEASLNTKYGRGLKKCKGTIVPC